MCWLFPLAGATLYYLFGVNRVQTRAVRVFGSELPQALPRCPDRLPRIAGADPEEVRELVRAFEADPAKVILMPEGIDADVLRERGVWLAEICKREGFRFSPRLHVELWGNRRGT